MRAYRCKCGAGEAFGEVAPCWGCSVCGGGFGLYVDKPKDHEFLPTKVDTDEGEKTLSRCRYCMETPAQIAKKAAK